MFSELENSIINEAFLTWKDHSPKYLSRNEQVNINSNIIAVLKHEDGHIEPHFTKNLVVDTGEAYYMELIAQDTPTDTFNTMVLDNPSVNDTISALDNFSDLDTQGDGTLGENSGAEKVIDGTYPKRDDDDVANPGRGQFVFTWRTSYLTTDFNTDALADVRVGMITPTDPTGTDPILNHWNFTSPFAKPSTAALVVWVNHTLVGV